MKFYHITSNAKNLVARHPKIGIYLFIYFSFLVKILDQFCLFLKEKVILTNINEIALGE